MVFNLEETLERNALTVNQKPMNRQDNVRTWRQAELLQSGFDLRAEGEARIAAARHIDPTEVVSQEVAAKLVREERRRRG